MSVAQFASHSHASEDACEPRLFMATDSDKFSVFPLSLPRMQPTWRGCPEHTWNPHIVGAPLQWSFGGRHSVWCKTASNTRETHRRQTTFVDHPRRVGGFGGRVQLPGVSRNILNCMRRHLSLCARICEHASFAPCAYP